MTGFNPLRNYKDLRLEEFNFNTRNITKSTFWGTALCSAAIVGSILPWTDNGILGWHGEYNSEFGIRILVLILGIMFLRVSWRVNQHYPDVFSVIAIDTDSEDSKLNLTITSKNDTGKIANKDKLTLDNSKCEFYYVGNLIFLECKLDRLRLQTGVIDHYSDFSSKRNEEVLTICFEINSKEQTSPKELSSLLNEITANANFSL
jgi:hypothetical protein